MSPVTAGIRRRSGRVTVTDESHGPSRRDAAAAVTRHGQVTRAAVIRGTVTQTPVT